MPLAEHDFGVIVAGHNLSVSIHVPLAEHDRATTNPMELTYVSIHVPLAEHDVPDCDFVALGCEFQFTCPSRSTTTMRP